jgi:hypothetical protein
MFCTIYMSFIHICRAIHLYHFLNYIFCPNWYVAHMHLIDILCNFLDFI